MGNLLARIILESGDYSSKSWFGNIKRYVGICGPHYGVPVILKYTLGLSSWLGISASDMKALSKDPRYPSCYQDPVRRVRRRRPAAPPQQQPYAAQGASPRLGPAGAAAAVRAAGAEPRQQRSSSRCRSSSARPQQQVRPAAAAGAPPGLRRPQPDHLPPARPRPGDAHRPCAGERTGRLRPAGLPPPRRVPRDARTAASRSVDLGCHNGTYVNGQPIASPAPRSSARTTSSASATPPSGWSATGSRSSSTPVRSPSRPATSR